MDYPIQFTQLEPVLVASQKIHVENRDPIPSIIQELARVCGEAVCGDPLVIFHGGAVKDGFIVEVAIPVSQAVHHRDIKMQTLTSAPALCIMHMGPHATIRESVLKVYAFLDQHAWTVSLFRREIYRHRDTEHLEKNLTEVQVILHPWDQYLAEGIEKELGLEARAYVMKEIEAITPSSSAEDYITWIQGAVSRLDELSADVDLKCRVMCHCAHVFPQERIDHLREVYQKSGVDAVLHEMYLDPFWYENPVRVGNVIHMLKNPFNPEGYQQATTPAERRKAYCHCAFVHSFLDEVPSRLSPTFCSCSAGWYTRLWEGILSQPVKIEHVETLLKGSDGCRITITLPLELDGECHPD